MTTRTNKLIASMVFLAMAVAAVAPSYGGDEVGQEDVETQNVPNAGYEKGFFIQSSDQKFKTTVNGFAQTRFTYEGEEQGEDTYNFSIPRARLKLSGHAFTPRLTYVFQTEFGKGSVVLKDFYGDAAFVPGIFHLRVGQFKRPFARQAITPASKLEMVDRAYGDSLFQDGRDLGFMFHNNFTKAKGLEWAVGLFNGTSEKPWFVYDADDGGHDSKFTNVPNQFYPTLVARLGYNYGGIKGYSEADLEGGGFRFAVAAAGFLAFKNANDAVDLKFGGDCMIKVHGFSLTGDYYRWITDDNNEYKFHASTTNIQVGYVIVQRVQPVLRYSFGNPDSKDNTQHEMLGGVSLYIFGQQVKWQNDGGLIYEESGNQNNWIFRSQLQFGF